MAFSARNDPFSMQLHAFPGDQRSCFQSIGKLDALGNYNAGVGAGGNCKKPAAGLNLSIKSCFEDSRRTWDKEARAFAPGLARDLEIISYNEPQKVAETTTDTRGAYRGGNPLDFSDYPLRNKITVAVDVDEVLGNFVSALNKFIADRYSLKLSVSEYHVYEFFKIWNCSRQEADIRVHEFFKLSYFKKGIHPIPGAQRALHRLSRFCDLSVVTSRQNVIKDHTIEWLEKYYPGLFQEVHFGNHFALHGKSRPKSEICRYAVKLLGLKHCLKVQISCSNIALMSFSLESCSLLGAKILIDDNPRYAVECAQVGIRVLLFDYENSYPWCKTESIDKQPLVTRVNNWEEVEQQIAAWIFSSTIP